MIKVFIDPITNKIVKAETVTLIEKIVDFDINESIVFENWEVLRLKESKEGKVRLEELLANEPKWDFERQLWKAQISYLQS